MTSAASILGYNGTLEETYTIDHPDVVKWTNYFHNIVNDKKIFEKFNDTVPKNFSTAKIVATGWHAFSEFMPWFLCRAASMVSNNRARHYVIQTAFEELGMRDCNQIHPDMFWKAANSIGVTTRENSLLIEDSEIKDSLNFLKTQLQSYQNDMTIFGILLGLEIPAVENIETIFNALAYNKSSEKILNKELFFQLHRVVETEHVRLTVSNFLRFKKSDIDVDLFVQGFMDGINFSENYWSSMQRYILNSPTKSNFHLV